MSKPNDVTRKNDSKVIYYNNVKHKFFPAPSFPPGKLPTKKDVIQCMLSHPKNDSSLHLRRFEGHRARRKPCYGWFRQHRFHDWQTPGSYQTYGDIDRKSPPVDNLSPPFKRAPITSCVYHIGRYNQ